MTPSCRGNTSGVPREVNAPDHLMRREKSGVRLRNRFEELREEDGRGPTRQASSEPWTIDEGMVSSLAFAQNNRRAKHCAHLWCGMEVW